MQALDQKLWRDLWQIKGQAIAIALVVACAVATYLMFISTLTALTATRDNYYRDYRFAEVFASLKRAPESIKERIAEIPGVDQVETRVVANVSVDIPAFSEPVTARLVSIPDGGEMHLNRLYLRAGRLVERGRGDEVILSDTFARAHGLRPGARLAAVINGHRQVLTVVGTALSPEYVQQLRPGGVFPDFKRYGILWMGRTALGHAYGQQRAFNDVALKLYPGVSAEDVIDRLDELLKPYGGLGAYAREDQLSHRFLAEEFKQLDALVDIFPVIFLGVAAFLLNVVVSRLVGMQREQIATLKAFGYSSGAVVWHYLKLVLVITAAGVALGTIAGLWLGQKLATIYMAFYRFPYLEFFLGSHVVVEAAAISVAAAAAGTLFAVRQAARLRPAEAMRPEAPVRYRLSFIERIPFVQNLLSQPARMIIRHLQRRPVKSLLSVIGIAMACGMILTGLFQKDTMAYMVDVQYGLSQREDISLTFTEPTARRAMFELQALPGVEHVEVFRQVPVRLHHGHLSYRTGIRGVEPGGDIQRLLDADLRPIQLPAAGVLLTDYLGELLQVQVGDRLTVEVLEGSRPIREVTVVGLVKEYMGVSAYMHLDALNHFMREGPTLSGAYLHVDARAMPELFHYFKGVPRVAGVAERRQEIINFHRTMQETMLFFTYVATVFAVIISFGVIYNSARIALAERSRELASLRVLGLTRGEISYILLGELGLLTLIGIPLGLIVGRWLCALIAHNLQNDLYRVPLILAPSTYAFAATVVLVSAIVSGLVVRRKLDQLDLIAVLKTKE